MKKVNYTVIAVVGFIIILFFATLSEKAQADAYVSVGSALFNSSVSAGEFGYQFDNHWDVDVSRFGQGGTKKGDQGIVTVMSLSHRIIPNWRLFGQQFYIRLGVAHVDGSPLVGAINYRLGIGFDLGVLDFELGHYSSAGIYKNNTGMDGAFLRYKF